MIYYPNKTKVITFNVALNIQVCHPDSFMLCKHVFILFALDSIK